MVGLTRSARPIKQDAVARIFGVPLAQLRRKARHGTLNVSDVAKRVAVDAGIITRLIVARHRMTISLWHSANSMIGKNQLSGSVIETRVHHVIDARHGCHGMFCSAGCLSHIHVLPYLICIYFTLF